MNHKLNWSDCFKISMIFVSIFLIPFVLFDITRGYFRGQDFFMGWPFWASIIGSILTNILGSSFALKILNRNNFVNESRLEVIDEFNIEKNNWIVFSIKLTLLYILFTACFSAIEYYFLLSLLYNLDTSKVFIFLLEGINNYFRGGAFLAFVTLLYLLRKQRISANTNNFINE